MLLSHLNKDEDFKPMMLHNNRVIASQSGLNIFIGEKGVAVPREDKALEFDRPIYFLKLLDNLIKKSPTGYLRLKLRSWPVVLRMDDPPANWDLISRKMRILKAEDYVKIMETLSKYGAKMSIFVTPAYIDGNGDIKSWRETDFKNLKQILEVLREGLRRGVFEIGCHGLTHLTIGYKPLSLIKRLFVKHKLTREFYDSKIRREIPYDLQRTHIKEAVRLIEEYFDVRPVTFAPPAHVWDCSTERILVEMNIPYLSADMNFYLYPEGHNFRKNPSFLGETAYNDMLLYVSATILGSYGTFKKTLKLFNELGIPLVWQQHNYYPSWFAPSILQTFFKDLEAFKDKEFMFISELGDLLRKYRRIKICSIIENGSIRCSIDTEIPVKIKAYHNKKTYVQELKTGFHEININLNSC
ncbi:MAG: DUF2334 domain-containing protein [Promethearchaeota archaeon]